MLRIFVRFALLVLLAATQVACAAAAPLAPGEAPATLVRPARAHRSELPPGQKIFIRQRGVIVQIQDPHIHMARAQRAYARGRSTLAAGEVEKVRGGVLWFEERASGERRRRLQEAAQGLRKLERQLRRREVDSYKVLDGAFQEILDVLGGPSNPRPAAAPGSSAD